MSVTIPTQISQEILNKYSIVNNSFKLTKVKNPELDKYKNEPKDEINVIIGDDKQPGTFYPQIKIQRWSNEVNFSVRFIDNEHGQEKVETIGDKIKWSKGNINIEYYDTKNGYVSDVILKSKPAINKIEFTIQSKGLDFFYQPPLTQEYQNGYSEKFQKEIVVSETQVKDLEGNVLVECPENVVGSYAVYHQTKGGMNDINGKDYKVGKAFHIYRPHIIDSAGNETWGEMNIENGIMMKTIPQEFLDNAVYPVMMGTPGTAIGYFNTKHTTEDWETTPENMVDGNTATYAVTNNDNEVQLLTSHTAPPHTNISKVEIRAYGYTDGNETIYLRPVFLGGDGDNHTWTMPVGSANATWSSWYDITADTNAPADWDVAFQSLDVDVEYEKVGAAANVYVSKVEVRETYDNETFGYTTLGSLLTAQYDGMNATRFTMGVNAGTGDSITVGLQATSPSLDEFKCAVYLFSDKSLKGVTNEGEALLTKSWVTVTFASVPSLLASTDYALVTFGNYNVDYAAYDSGTSNYAATFDPRQDYSVSSTFPNPFTGVFNDAHRFSIYATYTPAGAGAPPKKYNAVFFGTNW